MKKTRSSLQISGVMVSHHNTLSLQMVSSQTGVTRGNPFPLSDATASSYIRNYWAKRCHGIRSFLFKSQHHKLPLRLILKTTYFFAAKILSHFESHIFDIPS